jgi:hypothetical protein
MGSLRSLSSTEKTVHILQTNSGLADIFVYDSLKKLCGASIDSIVEVDSRATFMSMLELVNMQPLLADRWLFAITYKGAVKSLVRKYEGIFKSDTSVFLIRVENYKDFKDVKQFLPFANDLYLNVIKGSDLAYLFEGVSLSSAVLEFIGKSYYKEPEKAFMLRKEIKNGATVETTKDVVDICGKSTGSIAQFAMRLLNEMPTSKSGLKRVYSSRIKVFSDLVDTFGVQSLYNFLIAVVKDFLDIKVLYLQGVIYDCIGELPEPYDEKRLSRHSMYLKRLTTELSYEDILRLYMGLRKHGRWVSAADGLRFLYEYYLASNIS